MNTSEKSKSLRDFKHPYGTQIKIKRLLWGLAYLFLVRPLPKSYVNPWIRMIYRLFGAQLTNTSAIHPSAKVFMPWNLKMGENSTIGSYVDVYNPALITIGNDVVVSERTYLCTASHNIQSPVHEQIEKPIHLCDRCWVAAHAYIGMGVTIGEGSVVGATASVYKDVEPWTVVGGNPAKFLKKRVILQ